jgi:tRNA (guanine-N7-)-methyltransferase
LQAITDLNYTAEIIKNNSENIEIEIGCGNGHFITQYRESNSSILIGIDVKNKRCIKTLKKVKNKGLDNIFIFRCKAEEFIETLPAASIKAFHIYFPDPWPKNRHRKRRFFRTPQLDRMTAALSDKGIIYFATDFFDYYLQAKILMGFHNNLKIRNSADPPVEIFNSVFCKRFLENNSIIYFVCAEKN